MRHERILLILILGELVLIVLGAIAEPALEPAAAPSQISTPVLTALWAAVVAGTLLSWIGLLYLLREARGLYLGSWVAYLVLNFLRGPVVETPLGSVIRMLMTLVGGGILGLIYFSELRTKFRPLAQVARSD
jgi:hypothetical protein